MMATSNPTRGNPALAVINAYKPPAGGKTAHLIAHFLDYAAKASPNTFFSLQQITKAVRGFKTVPNAREVEVVATQKSPEFEGMKLLFIQPYINRDRTLVASGSSVVAVDSVGAGVGELVLFTQGSSARLTHNTKGAPVDAVIVGIVDSVEVGGVTVEKP